MLNPLTGTWQPIGLRSFKLSRIDFIFVVLAAFQVKHFICDGPLQTLGMVVAKSHYGQWLGLVHAAVHGIGTVSIFLIAGTPAALLLAAVDAVAHYHVDFVKEIQPIFQKSCIECHGPDKQKGKLRLDNKEAALKGGEDGPAATGHARSAGYCAGAPV